jgi:uncharacterized membrane-anchored protein
MRIEKDLAYPFAFWAGLGVCLGQLFTGIFDYIFFWGLLMTIIFARVSYNWYIKTGQTLTDFFISSIFSIPFGCFLGFVLIQSN